MNWWPGTRWGWRVLAVSMAGNAVLAILLMMRRDQEASVADAPVRTVPEKIAAPRAAPGLRKVSSPGEPDLIAVPVEIAAPYLAISMRPAFDAWPPVLSADWCRALEISVENAGKCNALLAKAIERMADTEAANLKITVQNGQRSIIMEDTPPGTREAALADFENLLRRVSAHPELVERCLESVRENQALFSWEEGQRRRVSWDSGLLHLNTLDADGKPLDEGITILLPVNPNEARSAADVRRYAHIYEAFKSIANDPAAK